jgi:multicomponent Na+:H+ antiporter subunit D
MMGLAGGLLTGDIFNLYVWFEVSLIASFVLMVLGGERDQIAGGLKYVALNLMSSALFLSGVGLLYGLAGTLNLADLALKVPGSQAAPLAVVAMFFLAAFGIKAALFPFFFWLPASYHTPPAAIAAFFAGSLTKLGIYALIRVFTLVFVDELLQVRTLVLVLAGLTMLTGVLGAIAQTDLRRILSFQIVSHIGYMAMGLGLFTPLALAGAVFYIIHEVIVKTNLFLVSGVVAVLRGTSDLRKLGGLYQSHPALAVVFVVPALALSGMPPLSGFFPKAALVRAGLDGGQYWISAIALVASLLTLYSMMKIWTAAFWAPAGTREDDGEERLHRVVALRHGTRLWAPVAALTLITVGIGAAAGPLFTLSAAAADQLLRPDAYIRAVLGSR